MDQAEALAKVRDYRKLVERHLSLEKVFLFGSYARGLQRVDSDIDVAIVVRHIEGDFFSTSPLLWKLRREIDDRIEPLLIEREHDRGGFLDEIQRYGIEVK